MQPVNGIPSSVQPVNMRPSSVQPFIARPSSLHYTTAYNLGSSLIDPDHGYYRQKPAPRFDIMRLGMYIRTLAMF